MTIALCVSFPFTGSSPASASSRRTTNSERLCSHANCSWSITSRKSSPVDPCPLVRSYSRRSMSSSVLCSRSSVTRSATIFCRAGFCGPPLSAEYRSGTLIPGAPLGAPSLLSDTMPPISSTYNDPALFMVALLAYRQPNRQPVLLWRQRARGVRRIRAGRILQLVEIQHQFASLVETMVRESRIQKTASAIRCGAAGRVTQHEKQFGDRGILQDRIQPVRLALQLELGSARDLRRVASADQRGNGERLLRRVGNPPRGHPVCLIRPVPFQPVKTPQRRRLCILDPQRKTLATMNHVHVERSDRQPRVIFVVVRIRVQRLRLDGLSVD